MSVISNFLIRFSSKLVGVDEFGNEYYLSKKKNYLEKNIRYVIYNGINEGSKVPPSWHPWLHYAIDEIPNKEDSKLYKWQKEHIPNLTGTKHAYKQKDGQLPPRNKYSSWKPV